MVIIGIQLLACRPRNMTMLFSTSRARGMVIVVSAALLNPTTQVPVSAHSWAFQIEDSRSETSTPTVPDLPLEPPVQLQLKDALQRRDYKDAERLLLTEAERDPKSVRSAKLLSIAAGIFFLDRQYPESLLAWKKSEAIAPLDDRSRFTRAMAYIHLNHANLARPELERLASAHPQNALYLYWLARLDYDRRDYAAAISKFQKVITLDPGMIRAHDILGLCHEYVGRPDAAAEDFHRAIELNRQQAKPSPWPNLDFAVVLIEQNHLEDAEKNLREAIGYAPRLSEAYFQLGRVLDKLNREPEAIKAFQYAADLDQSYPDPHYQLGRIYRRLGNKQLSEQHINQFLLLKKRKGGKSEPTMSPQDAPAEP